MKDNFKLSKNELEGILPCDRKTLDRLKRVEERYRRLREDPDGCSPCVQILVPEKTSLRRRNNFTILC